MEASENSSQVKMGSLVISGKIFPLYKGLNLIGRSKQATVVLKNESVSQHQAIIAIIDENQHFLSDVFSSNGTLLQNNKLHPLKMYELEQDNVIEFAKIVATYIKAPGKLNNTSTLPHTDNGDLQSTQNVDDSFYSANTQAFDDTSVPSISEAHHNGYFDDGYDFNNLPSPPSVTTISPSKTGISIHEMPTQMYGVIDVSNPEDEIEIAHTGRHPTIHDLPTQLMFDDVAANICIGEVVPNGEEILNNEDVQAQKEVPRATSSTPLSIHFEPTQILNRVQDEDLDDIVVPQTQDSPPQVEILDVSEHVVDQTAINDSGVYADTSKMQLQRNSLTVIEATPGKETVSKSILDHISQHITENNETSMETDDSEEIIKQKKKCLPLDIDSEDDSESRGLPENYIHSTATSQSQEIGFKKKLLRQIDSDSDTETKNCYEIAGKTVQEDSMEIVTKNIRKYNKCRKLSSDSDNNEDDKSVERSLCETTKTRYVDKHEESSKIDSDCETDLELENETKANDSGSETDIESELVTIKTGCGQLTPKSGVSTNNKSDCLSDANHNQEINTTNDSESENCETRKISESNNETNISKRNSNEETFFIPATQCSDDDSDDFNLMSENTDVCVNKTKPNANNTEGSVLDISQKLDELRQRTLLEQNCSEESIHFGLTDFENTEDITNKTNDSMTTINNISVFDKKADKINVTLKKQPNIYQEDTQKIDELKLGHKLNTNKNLSVQETNQDISITTSEGCDHAQRLEQLINDNTDDIFMQPTQKFVAENIEVGLKTQDEARNIFDEATQKVDSLQSNKTNESDIFMLATQKLVIEQNNTFTTPRVKSRSTKNLISTSTPNNLDEDDIFLQATQKMDSQKLNTDEHTFLKPLTRTAIQNTSIASKSHNNDDIFLQSTQKLSSQETDNAEVDDIFLQSTQALPVSNDNGPELNIQSEASKSLKDFERKILVINQNIFTNSAQQTFDNKTCGVQLDEDEDDDNIFLQPTQAVIAENVFTTSSKDDDTFIQPNQNLIGMEENIFLQPTQEINSVSVRPDEEINVHSGTVSELNQIVHPSKTCDSRPSLSLLRKPSEGIGEDDEDESQLEVTFASQTVKLCSQVNTRPRNPLVNVLEESVGEDEEEPVAYDKGFRSESTSTKSYSELDVQPVNELDDFAITSKPSKKQLIKQHERAKKLQNSGMPETSESQEKSRPTSVTSVPEDQNSAVSIRITRMKPDANLKGKNNIKISGQKEAVVEVGVLLGNRNLGKASIKSNANVSHSNTNLNKRTALIIPHTSVAGNISVQSSKINKETSPKQTRSTRNRCKNLDTQHTEKPTLINDNKTLTSTNTRKAKNKLNDIDDESTASKTKRSKLEHVAEPPKVIASTVTRRGRKLDLDQQQIITKASTVQPVVGLNKRKPKEKETSKASIITISSTDDSMSVEEVPTTNKRRKQNVAEAVDKVVTTRGTGKEPSSADNRINGLIKSKRKQVEPKIAEETVDLQTVFSPERQRRVVKPKVVFTMLDDPQLEALIKRLGGSVVDTVKSSTVLVTGVLRRSQKLLSAVGEGKPICGPDWLLASKKAGSFLDPWDHLLSDKEAEIKWNFTLSESLNKSRNHKLLANISFHILTTVNTDVLKAAIESCGGKLVARVSAKHAENIIIIGNSENRTKYLKFLQQKPPVKVVAAEAVFDGVLRQELHWDDHLLL